MKKLILQFFVFGVILAMASAANGVVTLVGGTASITANVNDIVVVTVYSNAVGARTWGVYLRNNAPNADLQNAAVILTTATVQGAGNEALVTLTDPAGYDGDNYRAQQSGGSGSTKIYANVNWSTVLFVGHAVGTYYVDLYDYTASGGSYSSPPTPANTKTITVVPEPATIALLGLGGMTLLGIRKKKR